MELHDNFGNELRKLTEEERAKHLSRLKKEVILNSVVFIIAALIIGALVAYFAAESGARIYYNICVCTVRRSRA